MSDPKRPSPKSLRDIESPTDEPAMVTAPGALEAPQPPEAPTPPTAPEPPAPEEPSVPVPAHGDSVVYQSGPETHWPATVLSAAPGSDGPVCSLEVHERTGTRRVTSAAFSAEPKPGTWRYFS